MSGTPNASAESVLRTRAPQYKYYAITAFDLIPQKSTTAYDTSDGLLVADGGGCFHASMRLPQGSWMQFVQVWYAAGLGGIVTIKIDIAALNYPAGGTSAPEFYKQLTTKDTIITYPRHATVNIPQLYYADIDASLQGTNFEVCLTGSSGEFHSSAFAAARIAYTTPGD